MRKYSAQYILNAKGKLVPNHTLLTTDNGEIIDLIQGVSDEIEILDGVLTPGFINTHCHLELSNLKNKISEGLLLDGFIRDILKIRDADTETIVPEIEKADNQMWQNGIQGVGDISNTAFSFATKSISKIRYHTFIELLKLNSVTAIDTFNTGQILLEKLFKKENYGSLVPHASYSVPPELFQLIKNYHDTIPSTWSIHNQETASENELFTNGSGKLKTFFESININQYWTNTTGKNSLMFTSKFFPEKSKLMLVHNTFTNKADIDFLKETGLLQNTFMTLCINANLYIEKITPDIKMLFENECKLTVGTDSLASNHSLSILDELKTINQNFPTIPVEELLQWGTVNGAISLGWEDLGTFEKNKNPGVLLLSGVSPEGIIASCKVNRLI